MDKTVSVVIPAFNAAQDLPRCLESVFKQSYQNLEIIIVDDGSRDDTLSVAKDLSSQDGRCTVIHQDNAGLSGARNTGIDHASGKFLFFLDSDDFIGPDEIRDLVRRQAETDADMTIGGFTYVTPEGAPISSVCAPEESMTEIDFWNRAMGQDESVEFIVSCGKLLKRELFDHARFDLGKLHEDEFIIHRLVSRCHRIATASIDSYYYVQNPQSITHTQSINNYLDFSEAVLTRINYLEERGWNQEAWQALSSLKRSLSEAKSARDPNPEENKARLRQLRDQWSAEYRRLRTLSPTPRSIRDGFTVHLFYYAPGLFDLIRKVAR